MDRNQKHVPVIVLLDKQVSGDRTEIREWFEHSRFSMCEATDVFEAIEQLSDFTLETRPDVVLLNVDCCEDEVLLMTNVSDLPVVTVSNDAKGKSNITNKYFHANIGKMASQLDKLIPHH